MNFIFDFDGTICDGFDPLMKMINEFLIKERRKPVDPKEFKEKGIEEVIKDYKLSKVQVLVYIYFTRRKIAKYIPELKSFKGMPEVIKTLAKTNTLGIVSSNSAKNVEIFLQNNNLDTNFKFIYSSLSLFDKSKKIKAAMQKYHLNLKETVYIGDEVRDIEAAKKINLKSISVSWGYADKKLLRKHTPNFLISDPRELLSVEKQLQR